MLTHAFETWQVLRVCLHTGSRNSRSRAAIERLGTKFGGTCARYSLVAEEWPEVKARLNEFVAGRRDAR